VNTDPGLCRSCSWSRRVQSDRGSQFWLCRAADSYPALRKYPSLPVRSCKAWTPRLKAPEDDGDASTSNSE
jgi:hypothetical protein